MNYKEGDITRFNTIIHIVNGVTMDCYAKSYKHILKIEQENTNLKQALIDVREDIVFCIGGMKNEYACTDKRTNRELHTMTDILNESLQKIDEVLGDDNNE